MDYFKHYETLVERARNRNLEQYTENHHIWPKCIGGPDEKWNIVELTPEEHFLAHQLLIKIFPEEKGLIWAAHQMTCHSKTDKRNNNKLYGWLRRKNRQLAKQRIGKNSSSFGKPWYHHPETLDNIKCFPEEVPEGYVKGRKFKEKENTKCIICGKDTNSIKAKYCNYCREKINKLSKKSTLYKNLFEYEKEFIEEYKKTKSMNKSLKNLGYPGAKGKWFWDAKEILKKHNIK